MAKAHRGQVMLLLAGGGLLGGPAVLRRGVRSSADVPPWKRELSELEMVADVEVRLVIPDGRAVTTRDWPTIMTAVAGVTPDYDGIVMLLEPNSAVMAAVMVAAMAQSTGRPIVCVGTRPDGQFGVRSSVVNAVQTACSDVAGVLYAEGSHVWRAGSLRIGPEGQVSGQEVGKVDFGLRLGEQFARSSNRAWKIWTKLNDNVAVWPASYLAMTSLPPSAADLAGVVIASEPWRPLRADEYVRCRQLLKPKTAMVVTGPVAHGNWPDEVVRLQASPMVAAVWLMVALGQGAGWRKVVRRLAEVSV